MTAFPQSATPAFAAPRARTIFYVRSVVAITMITTWAVSAVSGIALWLAADGRGAFELPAALGLTKHAWDDIHVVASLLAICLTLIHVTVMRRGVLSYARLVIIGRRNTSTRAARRPRAIVYVRALAVVTMVVLVPLVLVSGIVPWLAPDVRRAGQQVLLFAADEARLGRRPHGRDDGRDPRRDDPRGGGADRAGGGRAPAHDGPAERASARAPLRRPGHSTTSGPVARQRASSRSPVLPRVWRRPPTGSRVRGTAQRDIGSQRGGHAPRLASRRGGDGAGDGGLRLHPGGFFRRRCGPRARRLRRLRPAGATPLATPQRIAPPPPTATPAPAWFPLAEPGPYAVGMRSLPTSPTPPGVIGRCPYGSGIPPCSPPCHADTPGFVADAPPDPSSGPYPVILSSSKVATIFAPYLVTHGFAWVSVDGLDSYPKMSLEMIDQPLDILFALGQVGSGPPDGLEGMLDTEHAGVIGYSFDGYNALAMSGARIDSDYYLGSCPTADAMAGLSGGQLSAYDCAPALEWDAVRQARGGRNRARRRRAVAADVGRADPRRDADGRRGVVAVRRARTGGRGPARPDAGRHGDSLYAENARDLRAPGDVRQDVHLVRRPGSHDGLRPADGGTDGTLRDRLLRLPPGGPRGAGAVLLGGLRGRAPRSRLGHHPAPVTRALPRGLPLGHSERFASSSRRARSSTSRPDPAPVSTTTSPSSDATTRPRTRVSAPTNAATSASTGDAITRSGASPGGCGRRAGSPAGRPAGPPRARSCVTSTQRRVRSPHRSRSKSSRSCARVARVDRRERLVEQQQLRVQDQRAGEADALRLAARELARRAIPQVGDPEPLEPVARPAPGSRPAPTPRKRRPAATFAKTDVEQEQRRGQDQADPTPVGELPPRDDRRPRRTTSEPRSGRMRPARARRSVLLPAPFGTDDRERLARPDRELVDREDGPLRRARHEVADLDERGRGHVPESAGSAGTRAASPLRGPAAAPR